MGNRSTFVLNAPDEMQSPQPTGDRNLWLTDNERKRRALRRQSTDAAESLGNDLASGQQFIGDLGRNALGLPEAAMTVGTGLVSQLGTGLGTAAGMVADTLRNGISGGVDRSGNPVMRVRQPDIDSAAETIGDNSERFTYQPKTEGGQGALRGVGEVMAPLDEAMKEGGQRVSQATGSPLAGALTYGGLNFLGPEHGAPVVAALRGSKALTGLIERAGASRGIASTGRRARQSGAWVPGDIAETPGDFSMRSPTVDAFTRLKPQEQVKLPGRQLMKALQREGAKKEELTWMGLDKVLDTDEPLAVADVKRLAESNAPKIEHVQARAGEDGGELDDDKVHEAVSEAVSNDDDLRYPVTLQHRAPGTRRYETYDQAPGNFDSHDEAMDWLDEHKKELVEHETNYYLENIGEHFDEEQLAEMSDEQKQEWAESAAESSVGDQLGEFETENDYDSGAINEEELRDYHEQRIRENPADYGLEGTADAPDYGEYTVGQHGREPEANYTVATGKLAGESRFGRNMGEPSFLEPHTRAERAEANARNPDFIEGARGNPDMEAALAKDLQDSQAQLSLLPEEAKSKAYQREALRRGQVAEDPNASKYRSQSNLSHYRDMGKNQMYFTRETHRPAPDWGTVQRGVGRVDETGLGTNEGAALPESNDDNPLAFLEEAQSDWYQKGRKTGWADPKGIGEIEKQKVDREAQLGAFKQQAVGELSNLWTNPHVAEVIKHGIAAEGKDSYLASKLKEWADLQPGGELVGQVEPSELQDARLRAGRAVLREIGPYAYENPPAQQLIEQTAQGLSQMENMSSIPGTEDLTPTGPMRETPQYTQLAMADALRRAVQEGKQYFGWTPPDVHAHRWGTESMQYAPSAENPRMMRARFGTRRLEQDPGTMLEKLQGRADELLGDDVPSEMFNLDDPNIDKLLHEAVEANLDYGMSDYPDPNAQRAKRAAGIKKDMERLSQRMTTEGPLPDEGTIPRRAATHNSPRAYGYESAYGPMEKHIIDILRRSGVKPPQIRDIPMRGDRGQPMRGFEIDPDLARAAKRGFILPY
jgi:hypothetical protein